jgi:hypothetical protein
MKTSNKDARQYVQRKVEFKGSNTFSELVEPTNDIPTFRYVVYSYGHHYPMFVAEWQAGDRENATWYENKDRYSVSTSKQRSQLHPHTDTTPLCTDDMKAIVIGGIPLLVARRANEYLI